MKVIVTTPDIQGEGGVENYFAVLKDYYSMPVEYLTIGRRDKSSEGHVISFCHLVSDNFDFRKKMRDDSIALVHLNPSFRQKAIIRDGLLLHIAKRAGKKAVVFFRGWDKEFEGNLHSWKLRLFRKVYFKADAMIVLAEEFKAPLREWGYTGQIYVETTTFDDDLIRDIIVDSDSLTRNYGTNILYLARIEKAKGIYEAIDAYQILKTNRRQLCLTVAGDGGELDMAKDYVRANHIQDVRFMGYVRGEGKRSLYSQADVYLFPTYHGEGMPNSVLEAMAFGLPIVTRPVGGIVDFFKNGKMGFITQSKDPKVFADLIEKLILDTSLRRRIGQFNHQYAKEHFLASKVAKRIENIYRNIHSET